MKHRCRAGEAGSVEAGRSAVEKHRLFEIFRNFLRNKNEENEK